MSSRKIFSKFKKIVSTKKSNRSKKTIEDEELEETLAAVGDGYNENDVDYNNAIDEGSSDSEESSSSSSEESSVSDDDNVHVDDDADGSSSSEEANIDPRDKLLQEEFLMFSNYRLLPGWCATQNDVIKSFREHYAPKYDTEDLLMSTEIISLLNDWYYRKIRKNVDISNDGLNVTYEGFHLNPRYINMSATTFQQKQAVTTTSPSMVDTTPASTYLPRTNPDTDTPWNIEDLSMSSSRKDASSKKQGKKSKKSKKTKKSKKKSKSTKSDDDDVNDGEENVEGATNEKKRKSSKKITSKKDSSKKDDKKKKKEKKSSKKELIAGGGDGGGEESVSSISVSMRDLDLDDSFNFKSPIKKKPKVSVVAATKDRDSKTKDKKKKSSSKDKDRDETPKSPKKKSKKKYKSRSKGGGGDGSGDDSDNEGETYEEYLARLNPN